MCIRDRFLTPETSRSDWTVVPWPNANGSDPRGGYEPLPVPGPAVLDLRAAEPAEPARVAPPFETLPGSNAWAVAGRLSDHGGAIVANDPHLGIGVPNLWFRCELYWDGGRAMGLGPPGVPGIAIGSNGQLAWGFTNASADQEDWIVVERDPDDPSRYRTPEGWEAFGTLEQELAVRGAPPETLELETTRWGVVNDEDWRGRPLVLRWGVLAAETVDVDLMELLFATELEGALEILRGWWGAGFNAVVVDAGGRVGWTVTGHLPEREGFDGTAPASWTEPEVGWRGDLPPGRRPQVVDPPGGLVVSANQRIAPPAVARAVSRTWLAPHRAERIGELLEQGLAEAGTLDEEALRRIQLDTRSRVHDAYRDLVLAAVPPDDPDARLARARALVAAWDGTAGLEQAGFRLLRRFRLELQQELLGPLMAPCAAADPDFVYGWPLLEEPVRRLLEERPEHLLPPGFASWDALPRAVFGETLAAIEADPDAPGIEAPWGAVHRAEIRHPLSRGLPDFAGRWLGLDMPADPLPGHTTTVRAADPSFGASMRMVVSPGREEHGFLHMPCGQSGHFLSPHYGDGHADWLAGRATPFLAGQPVSRFALVPEP